MMTRRELMRLSLGAPWVARAASPRLNVLLVAVDDLNNRIGCYGDPVVQTPNLDRLARRGVRFDRAYCNYPLCNPSRTSLLSGRRPDTTQIFDNVTPPRTYLKDVVFLPEFFKQHGYFTARVGKIAHGAFEHEVAWDISESVAWRPLDVKRAAEAATAPRKAKAQETGGAKLTWRATDGKDSDEPDGRTALRIVELLEQNRNRPFFIGCGFHKPHLPWVAPKKYFDLYPPEKVILPATPANDRDDIPPIALTHTPGDELLSELDKRKAVAAYHAATTFMDAQLGLVLDALDRFQLWDRTVVLLFGDHGWHLNDHLGLWRKMTVFEEVARAPLLVAAPGKQRGVGCPRLVEFVDIYPTLVDLCGLPLPSGLEGTSFAPLLEDPQRPWKKAAFTQVRRPKGVMGRSVRTERYRYTEWGSDQVVEFYDHEYDPKEWTNLAGNPRAAKAMAEARALLRAGWRAALPPGKS